MAFKETIGGILLLGVAASGIWYVIEKAVVSPNLHRVDTDNNAVEQARRDAQRAEAQRQQEAAARANAEAEAERFRRQQIDEENRRARQDAADRAKAQAEADRLERQNRDAENRRRQKQAESEAQAADIERGRQAEAYRRANRGCNPGTHYQCFNCQTGNAPECIHIGGNGGCLCVRN
jgi:hypothetical protein